MGIGSTSTSRRAAGPATIYGPSETTDYAVCPVKWDLRRRWQNPHSEVSKVLGGAYHAGMSSVTQAMMEQALARPTPILTDLALGAASDALRRSDQDIGVLAAGDLALEDAETLVHKTIRATLKLWTKDDFLGDEGVILGVEEWMGAVGRGSARLDCRVRRGDGSHGVIDWKYEGKLESQWVPSRALRYETDQQVFHYAWRAALTWGQAIDFVLIILATPAPTARAWALEIAVGPERLALWLQDTQPLWDQMSRIERGLDTPIGRWTACQNKDENFGRCAMWDACHVCLRDEDRIATLYQPRRPYQP